jgi:hypothetical protein
MQLGDPSKRPQNNLSEKSATNSAAKSVEAPRQRSNIIVLTSGETGSSVLTGLIARGGYWTGNETVKKAEYDTYENSELVRLNQALLERSGFSANYMTCFSQSAIDGIASLLQGGEDVQYSTFVAHCEAHRPWIWKDPRLWLTIRAWAHLLDLSNCKFVLLTRSIRNAWVSTTLRRRIWSYGFLKRYEEGVRDSLVVFLRSYDLSFVHVSYEGLITRPEQTISDLNEYLATDLSLRDLEAIYRGALYKAPRSSALEFVKAVLIYLKNYSERLDIAELNKSDFT